VKRWLRPIAPSQFGGATLAAAVLSRVGPRSHTRAGFVAAEYLCALHASSRQPGHEPFCNGSTQCKSEIARLLRLKNDSALRITSRKIRDLRHVLMCLAISPWCARREKGVFPLTPNFAFSYCSPAEPKAALSAATPES
jgi:hypothetical protein